MINLGEIQVRFLEVGRPDGWSPSALYMDTAIPGQKKQYIPRKTPDGEWEVMLPITQDNLDFCEKHLYMVRGNLLALKRKEIRNPFHAAKQKKWFENDLSLIEEENEAREEAIVSEEESVAIHKLKAELIAHSQMYWREVGKAREYQWPIPFKTEEMFELELSLGGVVLEAGNFQKYADLQTLKDQHTAEREEQQTRQESTGTF